MHLSPRCALSVLLPLLLAACNGRSAGAPPDDTSSNSGDDSAVGDDTGEPDHHQYGEIAGSLVYPEGVVEAVDGTIKVGLVRIVFGAGPALEETLLSTGIEGRTSYRLALEAAPPASSITGLEEGIQGAMYVPLAFVDQDGDGSYQPGDRIVGGSLSRLAVWLEEDGPKEGFVAGWSVIDTGLSGSYESGNCLLDTTRALFWRQLFNPIYPVAYGLEEPVDVSLQGLRAGVTLGGEIAAGSLPEEARIALLPAQVALQGASPDELPSIGEISWDEEDGSFALRLEAEPPEVLDITSDPGWNYALGFAVPYVDADADGAYSSGEAVSEASLCADDTLAAVRYTWPVEDYASWRLMECYGVVAGWRVVTREDSGVWAELRSDAEAADLQIDEAECSL